MDLGIDIGGSKTLLAIFSEEGKIIDERRFATNKDYAKFLKQLDSVLKAELSHHKIKAAACAIAGYEIDRQNGIVPQLGNLPWTDIQLKNDLAKVLKPAPVWIENDAKLGGLSEALLVAGQHKNVLYITLGTGVGVAHVEDGKIDTELSDKGGRGLVLEHDGQLTDWDDLASGRRLVAEYGKTASELDDPAAWAAFSANVAKGLVHFVEVLKPDVVIIGGGVGSHFEKFEQPLREELAKQLSPAPMPPLIKARRPEEAVIYGCYDYIQQQC